jgi:lysine/ornithine N-monooxygenase
LREAGTQLHGNVQYSTSTPRLPDDVDWTQCSGTVLHSKDVGQRHEDLTSSSFNSITVAGGSKSAVDVVNLCALARKQMNWIIGEEGWGPGFLLKARSKSGNHLGMIKAKQVSGIAQCLF